MHILPGKEKARTVFAGNLYLLGTFFDSQAIAVPGEQGAKMQPRALFFGDFLQHEEIHDIAVRPDWSAHGYLDLIRVSMQGLTKAAESDEVGGGEAQHFFADGNGEETHREPLLRKAPSPLRASADSGLPKDR